MAEISNRVRSVDSSRIKESAKSIVLAGSIEVVSVPSEGLQILVKLKPIHFIERERNSLNHGWLAGLLNWFDQFSLFSNLF